MSYELGSYERTPCQKCGGPKPPGRGLRHCSDCREVTLWERERKWHTRARARRKPCAGCGRLKPDGHGRRLCDECIALRARKCQACQERPPRASGKAYCEQCFQIAQRAARRRKREWLAKQLQDPSYRETYNARAASCRRRLRQEDGDRVRANERLDYRIAQANAGRPIAPVAKSPSDGLGHTGIPGRPLAAAITRAASRTLPALVGEPVQAMTEAQICEATGVLPRHVYAWRIGERGASLDAADRVLIALDLEWEDIWNEDTVRVPLLEVRSYSYVSKKGARYRTLHHTRLYGDRGPDLAELERVSALMEGRRLPVAA